MKKTICSLLVISILLATIVGYGLTVTAIKDAQLLDVKYQCTLGVTLESEETDLRVIAAVDGLNAYSHVGWCFSLSNSDPKKGGINVTHKESTSVYTGLKANGQTLTVRDIYKNIETANYIFVYDVLNIPNESFDKDIYVRSYVINTDGTIEYGDVKTINVKDYISDSLSSLEPSSSEEPEPSPSQAPSSSTPSIVYESNNSGWTSRWY